MKSGSKAMMMKKGGKTQGEPKMGKTAWTAKPTAKAVTGSKAMGKKK